MLFQEAPGSCTVLSLRGWAGRSHSHGHSQPRPTAALSFQHGFLNPRTLPASPVNWPRTKSFMSKRAGSAASPRENGPAAQPACRPLETGLRRAPQRKVGLDPQLLLRPRKAIQVQEPQPFNLLRTRCTCTQAQSEECHKPLSL